MGRKPKPENQKKEKTLSFRIMPELHESLKKRISTFVFSENDVAQRDLERYYIMLRRELAFVELTENEAMLICDVCNGTIFTTDFLQYLYVSVEDGDALDGVGVKWGVDVKALADKLKNYTIGQNTAIIDAVERFWIAPNEENRLKTVGLIR